MTKLVLLAILTQLLICTCHTTQSDFPFDQDHLDNAQRDKLFAYLDTNKDQELSKSELKSLLRQLFYSTKQKKSYVNDTNEDKLFAALDFNAKDKRLRRPDFNDLWDDWIKVILKPRSALIVVDMQNDFVDSKGHLRVDDGYQIVEPINDLIRDIPFDVVVYTYDWHPSNHCSFIENVHLREVIKSYKPLDKLVPGDNVTFAKYPDIPQVLWPSHCVQNSWGAEIHQNISRHDNNITVSKGVDPDIDSYSAFKDNGKGSSTILDRELRLRGITDIYMTGVLYDFCVGSTAIDGLDLFYRTAFIEDAVRSSPDLRRRDEMRHKLVDKSAKMITSEDVLDMVEGRDRTVEMGVVLAHKLHFGVDSNRVE